MFSVVIPLYNKEEYIEDTVRSVLSQTYKDFELLIVNDSSTDKSLDVVSSIKDKRIRIFSISNSGVSAARNYGIQKANGEFIAFLDADDIWDSTYLESVAKMIFECPEAGLYCTSYRNLETGVVINEINDEREFFYISDYFDYSIKKGLSLNITSATCVRRKIFENLSAFRVGIKRGEDIDLWLRIALNYPIAFFNRPLMLYRTGTQTSLSSNYTCSKDEFPYEEWLNYKSYSSNYMRYVILVIYIYAKRAYQAKDYNTCYRYLNLVKSKDISFKGLKRLYLVFMSMLRR